MTPYLIFIITLSITAFLGLVCYIFQSIGLYSMAKKLELESPWMAWIPIISIYLFGEISSKYVKNNGRPSVNFNILLISLNFAIIGASIAISAMLRNGIINNKIYSFAEGMAFLNENGASFISAYLILFVLTILFYVVYYIALWRMFAIFDNNKATAFLVVSILLGAAIPFLIFAVSKKKPALTFADRTDFVAHNIPQQTE